MDVDALVVRPGTRVSVTGVVSAHRGRIVVDPPGWQADVDRGGGDSGTEPAEPGAFAVPVLGVDLDALVRRREASSPTAAGWRGGWVQGATTLRGVWDGRVLHVDDQRAPVPSVGASALVGADWSTPPCPPPPGGWPVGPEFGEEYALVGAEEVVERATVVTSTVFRPAGGGPVWVVAAEDVGAARRVLGPVFGTRVCVVASRFTRAQVERAEREVQAAFDRWPVTAVGRSSSSAGQAVVWVQAVRVTPQMAQWVVRQPAGLVAVSAWMVPAALER